MPLTAKGNEVMSNMEKTYHSPEKAKQVFYAMKNAGKLTGVDESPMISHWIRFHERWADQSPSSRDREEHLQIARELREQVRGHAPVGRHGGRPSEKAGARDRRAATASDQTNTGNFVDFYDHGAQYHTRRGEIEA